MSRHIALGISLPMVGRGLGVSRLLAELNDEVLAAESAGLDLALVPEHHVGPPGSLTAPLTVAAWLLARTSTIRIGTGVLLLPLHAPIRVAEEAALLQQASQGRFVLGVGAGYQQADFDLFGVDRRRRAALLEEAMAALSAIWSGRPQSGISVRPSLDGDAPPPVWLGAWSAAGVRRAAALADGWIADPIRTVDEVETMAAAYRAAAAAAGRPEHVVVMREGWVDTSTAQARASYGPAVSAVYRYYLRHGAFPLDSGVTDADLTFDGALAQRVILGSASEVADQLARLVDRTGARTVVLALRHPSGPAHGDVMAAIHRLGADVLPRLRHLLQSREGDR